MSRPRKYIKGPAISEPLTVIHEVLAGRYVFMFDRPKHPSFLISMQVQTINFMTRKGSFSLALPNPDHPDRKKEKESQDG